MEITKALNNNYATATKWSNRSKTSGHFDRLKKKIEFFLVQLSGNDLSAMIEDVLKNRDLNCKHKESLKKMSGALNDHSIIKPRHRHHIMRPFREAGLSLSQINKLGFKCSHGLWAGCLNPTERKIGGAKPIETDLVTEINTHMESLSESAANKTIISRRFLERNPYRLYKKKTTGFTYEPVRYRKTTLLYAYTSYRLKYKDDARRMKIPFSTFSTKINALFKKPFRKTDLCDYCAMGKEIESEIKQFITAYNFDFKEEFNSSNLIKFFTSFNNIKPEVDPKSEYSKKNGFNSEKIKRA